MIENGAEWTLKGLLEQEILLFQDFARQEQQLQDTILKRNWSGLEAVMRDLDWLSREIAAVENRRDEAVSLLRDQLSLHGECSFYEILARIADPLRSELSSLYRTLRLVVLRVKSYSGSIRTYVSSAETSVREVLDELLPERKGRLYTKNGAPRRTQERSLVLNRQL